MSLVNNCTYQQTIIDDESAESTGDDVSLPTRNFLYSLSLSPSSLVTFSLCSPLSPSLCMTNEPYEQRMARAICHFGSKEEKEKREEEAWKGTPSMNAMNFLNHTDSP